MGDKWAPPKEIRDLDVQSASNLIALIRDIRQKPITLALGSGVSSAVGLPIWTRLLQKICESFFMHWEWDIKSKKSSLNRPPRNLSICSAVDEYLQCCDSSKIIAKEIAQKDPLLVAQQIKNCIRESDWRYLCIKVLNDNDEFQISFKSKLINNLADICQLNCNIKSVINYNFDAVFEKYLHHKGISYRVIWEEKYKNNSRAIPVYHPHGCLPIDGGPSTRFILTESDYHRESTSPYSWANLIQSQLFSTSTCIFFGTSMVDPNIRRLLRISEKVTSSFHYVFLPCRIKPNRSETMLNALFDNDLYKLKVKTIRYPKTYSKKNPYSRLTTLVGYINATIRNDNTDKYAMKI